MPDIIPGDISTTATVAVGGSVSGELEDVTDRDWFRITLTQGQPVVITLNGITLEDPYLYIRDSSGALLFENDDSSGATLDSEIAFSPDYTGTYFIDVGAYDDDGTGTYQVSVAPYTPPPVGTLDQIADQLVSGFFDGDWHRFDLGENRTITVNIAVLNTAEQALARAALSAWAEIIGVQFLEVSGDAQIMFDNSEGEAGPIAVTEPIWADGIISVSYVQISSSLLAEGGSGLGSDSFQVYVHEVGHALGLGHAGNYNFEARFPFDAKFSNDGVPLSVMSYFDASDTPYFRDQGFTDANVVTPMQADILAMQSLYGLSASTNPLDTIYGFHSGSANPLFRAETYPNVAYTVFDTGGIDTFDFSVYSGAQTIDLRSEQFSNVLGNVGTISIARGVTIENAIGGSGNDIIRGNNANNVLTGGAGNDSLYGGDGEDRLDGGTGNDRMEGGAGGDTYVVDSASDQVIEAIGGSGLDQVFTSVDYTLAAGSEVEIVSAAGGAAPINLTGNELGNSLRGNNGANILNGGDGGNILTGFGGNDTLQGGKDIDAMFGGAGNDIMHGSDGDDALEGGAGDDLFDGGAGNDMASYAEDSAAVTIDLRVSVQNTGGAGTDTFISIESAWGTQFADRLTGTDSDNRLTGWGGDDIIEAGAGNDRLYGSHGDDLLTGGAGADLLEGGDGQDIFSDTAAGLDGDVIWDFQAGDTIVIRDANAATFSFSLVGATLTYTGGSLQFYAVPTGRIIAQAAAGGGVVLSIDEGPVRNDVNGDGLSDIIWRNGDGQMSTWLGDGSGFSPEWGTTVSTDWKIVGTGDFNGDDRADILWRSDGGAFASWLGAVNGGFAPAWGTSVATSWKVAGTGDFNGDGRDDVAWRNVNGEVSVWLGAANGGFAPAWGTSVATEWKIVGTGDFNGDGRDDMLWRHNNGALANWSGAANGGFTPTWGTTVGTEWTVLATGDFNGDLRADILWRSSGNAVAEWLGAANGGFTPAWGSSVSADLHLAAVGDYNRDGRDDIMWQSSGGLLTRWLGDGQPGFFVDTEFSLAAPAGWQVQPEVFL